MRAPTHDAAVGALLRDWRLRRRLSQLDLSIEAGISARHSASWRPAAPGRARTWSNAWLTTSMCRMAPQIVNLRQWRAHLLHRLVRQVGVTGDPALR